MSTISDEIRESMRDLMFTDWKIRDGQVVPGTSDVSLKDGAVRLDAVYLYADLADSTLLQKQFKDWFAAKIMRMYLHGTCKILRWKGGHIKSFDGDRVMAIFIGNSKRNDAARAALAISWLVEKCINPLIVDYLSKTSSTSSWTCSHGVGIDAGSALLVRAGVRNSSGGTTHNDLISIGRSPNVAAKLSARRSPAGIWITDDVYSYLNDSQKLSTDGKKSMWSSYSGQTVGPYTLDLHRSGWHWGP